MMEINNLDDIILSLAAKAGCFTKKQLVSMFKTRSLANIEKTLKRLYRIGGIHSTREDRDTYYFGKKDNYSDDTIKAMWVFIELMKEEPEKYISSMLESEKPVSITYMYNNSLYNICCINSVEDISLANIVYQRTIETSDEAAGTDDLYKWVFVYTNKDLLTKPLDSRMKKLKVFLDYSLDETRPKVLFAKE